MKNIIIAQDRNHLLKIIKQEIERNGNTCNLNHIDVSKVRDTSEIFSHSQFNGDISKWNVSKVKNMNYMFRNSQFNGDISGWNVCKVKCMDGIFQNAKFTGDISQWNVCSVEKINNVFKESIAPLPYWSKFNNIEDRVQAINSYLLYKEIEKSLPINNKLKKQVKI